MAGKKIDRTMYEGQNRMAALIIVGNPAKYPGLMAEWAAVILGAKQWPQQQKLGSAFVRSGGVR